MCYCNMSAWVKLMIRKIIYFWWYCWNRNYKSGALHWASATSLSIFWCLFSNVNMLVSSKICIQICISFTCVSTLLLPLLFHERQRARNWYELECKLGRKCMPYFFVSAQNKVALPRQAGQYSEDKFKFSRHQSHRIGLNNNLCVTRRC